MKKRKICGLAAGAVLLLAGGVPETAYGAVFGPGPVVYGETSVWTGGRFMDLACPDGILPEVSFQWLWQPDACLPGGTAPGPVWPDGPGESPEEPEDESPEKPGEEKPEEENPEKPDEEKPEEESPEEPEEEEPERPETDAQLTEVIALVNGERQRAGLPPLAADGRVQEAAAVRAAEIAQSFSHSRPDGRNFSTALQEAGTVYRTAGENIAWGQKSPGEVMRGWMESAGHRANILNESFSSIGVGFYQDAAGRTYWVQLFTG